MIDCLEDHPQNQKRAANDNLKAALKPAIS